MFNVFPDALLITRLEDGLILDINLGFSEISGYSKEELVGKKAEEEVTYLSYHDELTGLYNRRFYEEELVKLNKEENLPFGIIMGDVNGLKGINDLFGHAMGDLLLKKTGEILKKSCEHEEIIEEIFKVVEDRMYKNKQEKQVFEM